jgi:hypothetical protein
MKEKSLTPLTYDELHILRNHPDTYRMGNINLRSLSGERIELEEYLVRDGATRKNLSRSEELGISHCRILSSRQ